MEVMGVVEGIMVAIMVSISSKGRGKEMIERC